MQSQETVDVRRQAKCDMPLPGQECPLLAALLGVQCLDDNGACQYTLPEPLYKEPFTASGSQGIHSDRV